MVTYFIVYYFIFCINILIPLKQKRTPKGILFIAVFIPQILNEPLASCSFINLDFLLPHTTYPAGTQRSRNVPLWYSFGQDVLDHDGTKIGRIRFLTYFGSAMSGMDLASQNIEKFPEKPILWKMFKLTSGGRPEDVMLQVSFWDVFKTLIGRFSKTERIFNN